ncbi:DNA methyltransferase [Nesterenkonia suensis]
MPSYESIVLVEDWISEHYFTAEGKGTTFQKQVETLRKSWDREAKEGRITVLSRFTRERGALLEVLVSLGEVASETEHRDAAALTAGSILREILGLPGDREELVLERGSSDLTVSGARIGGSPEVLWLDASPAAGAEAGLTDTHLVGTNSVDGKPRQDQPVAKLLSELYLADPSPKYIVVSAGQHLYLTERERWPEGRYLAADVQLIADRQETRKYGEVDRFLAIFGRESLLPDADGAIWWDARLDESRQHAVGVSQDLREGIRESIEIIANDVLDRRRDQGLPVQDVDGQVLARQSLRFLYRILFLLYAEASPELGVLPKGVGEYDAGYGLERLRELAITDLPSHRSQRGVHLYESLHLLFQLVNGDHPSQRGATSNDDGGSCESGSGESGELQETDEGLTFEPLKADLFDPAATALIDEVRLSNVELQKVLQRLLLSRAGSKGERGFISYANLGINQLGAVYEGLMSYTGFIAQEDLREVAKNGDAEKGSWVVSLERAEDIEPKHFVTRLDEETGVKEAVVHRQGTFVFRLAGRERQQSASYYTPEVLTRFVVSQALQELLDEDTPADEILELSVCEPALGSGAFAIEAVRQLAEEYLTRKQKERGEEIPAEEYPQELQKVKAQIALHQVHGVDLNDTAVELAEVSLWLETMQPGLQAPWFGLRLKRGNSLIGARRATYSTAQVKAKKHLSEEPQAHPLTGLVEALDADRQDQAVSGRIHHFLLPGEGWGAAADAKEVKDLAGERQKELKAWAKSTRKALTGPQVTRLHGLAVRVETLWGIVVRRLQIAESQARRHIDYWPHERSPEVTTVSREEIEQALADPAGAYRRLKRVMDAWNALWFWPLTEDDVQPPTVDEWLDALEGLLGLRGKESRTVGQRTFLGAADWEELNAYEELDLGLATAASPERIEARHPWLAVCDRIAAQQGFFHWELEFAPVFGRGGFDLQVGNPPWVRPRSDEKALLAEHDPWWQLTEKPTQAQVREKRAATLEQESRRTRFIDDAVPTAVLADVLGSTSRFVVLEGLQPDLYRAFMVQTWRHVSVRGVVSLIHPESHFTEKKAQSLRGETYRRLRRHWQFINELHLFEIHNLVTYGVHVYGSRQDEAAFTMAASLYHPDTVERSFAHEGGTEVPGLKDGEGRWDTRPHPERIIQVTMETLNVWAQILDEPGTSPWHARMVYPVNRASMSVLEKLSRAPRVRELGMQYSSGWHETADRKRGYFEVGSRINDSWKDVILQGPHFTVATPFAKQPNPTMRSNKDWTELDLEALPADFIPRTSYQPHRSADVDYDADYGSWELPDGTKTPVRDHYRIAWRRMASTTGMRTLFPTVFPPHAAHVHPVYSAGPCASGDQLLGQVGLLAGIPSDFFVKVSGSAEIQFSLFGHLAQWRPELSTADEIVHRAARLTCLTEAYAPLWYEVMDTPWTPESPARVAAERRQLLVELDALAALSLGLTADELCIIYRTQFPVLRGYEQTDLYDANGRKVPQEMAKLYRKSGEDGMAAEDLRWTHPQSAVEYTFEFPFRSFDREEDMRAAYARFSAMIDRDGQILETEV